ncbi:DUF4349 domain-containing protein [Amycolatopsis suaedae]|uniref:DUF4349 domain-containing protein n=1 Tax=Amycolatopsis suaedae TaxID=2510978 RepID=A0A4V2EM98_9PSEU|nr:DUF4349 domain-containing protein [Amycolatopsis suaedae]RZQ64315.1 DUF4349 domain-containing protein [Amycolatopsis suaedae]
MTGRRVITGLVLGLLLVSGCTAQSGSENSAAQVARPEAGAGQSAPKQQAPAEPGKAPGVAVGQVDRKLARSATLSVKAGDVSGAVTRARQAATTAGGYAGTERTETRSATVTLVVPAERLDAVLGELSALGEVTRREQQVEDVTEQVVDVDTRLASQRASVTRVRALLERATSISEITSIERELTTREAELESLQARQKALAGSVAMSTITLNVAAGAVAAEDDDRGFLGGLAAGWRAFLDFGSGALTVLGAVAPFLVLVAIPVAVWWVRRRRKVAPAAAAE